MPLSTDNQDYGEKDKKNESARNTGKPKNGTGNSENDKLTSDDLKGKKVDADPTKESGKPANQ
jgi:hypothetical protein